MAKKAPSKHSRAARRATSPGIDTDKSLKNVKPPAESVNQRPAVLAAQHGAGVSKKPKKSGRKAVLSSRARRRHEKGMDRAEAVMDRTLSKIEKSKGQARTVQGRRKAWEDINTSALAAAAADDDDEAAKPKKKKTAKQLQAEAEQALVDKFYSSDDGDEDMDGADSDGGETRPAPVPQPGGTAADDDDDEIL